MAHCSNGNLECISQMKLVVKLDLAPSETCQFSTDWTIFYRVIVTDMCRLSHGTGQRSNAAENRTVREKNSGVFSKFGQFKSERERERESTRT